MTASTAFAKVMLLILLPAFGIRTTELSHAPAAVKAPVHVALDFEDSTDLADSLLAPIHEVLAPEAAPDAVSSDEDDEESPIVIEVVDPIVPVDSVGDLEQTEETQDELSPEEEEEEEVGDLEDPLPEADDLQLESAGAIASESGAHRAPTPATTSTATTTTTTTTKATTTTTTASTTTTTTTRTSTTTTSRPPAPTAALPANVSRVPSSHLQKGEALSLPKLQVNMSVPKWKGGNKSALKKKKLRKRAQALSFIEVKVTAKHASHQQADDDEDDDDDDEETEEALGDDVADDSGDDASEESGDALEDAKLSADVEELVPASEQIVQVNETSEEAEDDDDDDEQV